MNKAFVTGSNGPPDHSPLRYARKDVDDMARCLSSRRCAFDVTTPTPGSGVWAVRRQLTVLAGSCSANDTLVCYVSGHGVLDGGALFLLWDETDLDQLLATALPVSAMTEALRHCRARNKLLILDCCHAGAAVGAGFRDVPNVPVKEVVVPENHLVLMAGDRLQRTRELEELEGGFLTQQLCNALTDAFWKADKDGDRRLSTGDLQKWLETQAVLHNEANPDRDVPVPYLFGQQRGDFFLAALDAEWRRTTFLLAGVEFVLLPYRWAPVGREERAIALSRYPVLNREYEQFVNSTGAPAPAGQIYLDQKWTPGFVPWRDEHFTDPDMPVVCVDVADARAYADWLGDMHGYEPLTDPNGDRVARHGGFVGLPTQNQWDLGAFGTMYPGREPRIWLEASTNRHDRATGPASVDRNGQRDNLFGLADVIGNVWEWCFDPAPDPEERRSQSSVPGVAAIHAGSVVVGEEPENGRSQCALRGGGYLDDLRAISPFVNEWELKDGMRTRHSDVGFRLVAEIEMWDLADELREQLSEREIQSGAAASPLFMPVTA